MVKRAPRGQNTATKRPAQVRIIAGQWRGRKLPVFDREGLRPTPDRVRETLFNWLSPWLPGSHCLDCFSGSGALALEALSRGAEQARMLERDSGATRQLQENLATLGDRNGEVILTDSLNYLDNESDQPFDLIFIDPPFRQDLVARCCQLLEQNGWLADNALIYVEAERELELDNLPANWELYREKTAGQVGYRLFQRGGT
ncbi:16S rRNA (guanine(966)-N(2))-methyltransferase RsmD [Aestuariirhabdus sp. Z084]|uniref:16S rRNA (guanine(966)-N(2))-methyltransferase RsmD n=1 Tax=Aestuariirhabdus haliotis TaxID=2918751 RepID=UPI00201B3DC5|nr:16S rRNA (guanine(966)-N(2))-methyltransferase RsmD [Aestuariirhabdus haliotis]MCL6414174.1 16S rRNA (guanine(966)-N(2))-methyltransferase RsmD [Aestuariirhabdus haliotis]MCL6418106.1 16S rRNA (guanine(966)-N(2))-methyltransferase RsmD [Aestuariirhabdus haliotis]